MKCLRPRCLRSMDCVDDRSIVGHFQLEQQARGALRLLARLQLARIGLIADLQVPAVGILHMEALELVADHVGPRSQAAPLELGFHLVGVPRLDAERDVIDHRVHGRTISAPLGSAAAAAGAERRAQRPAFGAAAAETCFG